MTREESLLEQLQPELLGMLRNAPDYGSIGLNIILHEHKISRIDSSRTITMKVSKTKVEEKT